MIKFKKDMRILRLVQQYQLVVVDKKHCRKKQNCGYRDQGSSILLWYIFKILMEILSHVLEKSKCIGMSCRSCNGFMSNRSSRPEVFCKIGVLKSFAKFIGQRLCWSLNYQLSDRSTRKFLAIIRGTRF